MNLSPFKRALLALGLATSGAAMAADTIKVGMLTVDSGPFAAYMAAMTEPAKLAVEMLNAQGGAAGKKFELVIQSHSGSPAGAVGAASRVVKQEGAQFFMGFFTSSMALALSPTLPNLNALMIDTLSSSGDLIGKNCQANYFRVSAFDGMVNNGLKSLIKKSGLKTWNVLAVDSASGHAFVTRFTEAVAESGGKVQQTRYATSGTSDFGSLISQLGFNPAEGLAVTVLGSDGIALAKQQRQFGLFEKYKMVVGYGFTDEVSLPGQGDTTIGAYAIQGWTSTLPVPKAAAFAKAFEAAYKRKATYIEADVFTAFELLQAAINKANSTDVAAVRSALSGLKLSSVLGEVEMRAADHQLVRPVVVMQIVKGAEGKPTVALREVKSAVANTPPPNPECKFAS